MSRRVMLKISGEALKGEKDLGFDEALITNICEQVKSAKNNNMQICLLVGGGNLLRGKDLQNIDKYKADEIGMLSTVMNAIYLSEIFRKIDVETSVYGAFEVSDMVKLFDKTSILKDLSNNKIILLAGGTGHPYFTTDTGVVLRAIELNCDEVLLAKSVDGVYDSDPSKNPNAKKYETITLQEIYDNNLKVIDMTATTLSIENKMSFRIFSLYEDRAIIRAINGEKIGTLVTL